MIARLKLIKKKPRTPGKLSRFRRNKKAMYVAAKGTIVQVGRHSVSSGSFLKIVGNIASTRLNSLALVLVTRITERGEAKGSAALSFYVFGPLRARGV